MKKKKQNSGVSMVNLVITIIVIVILAAVTFIGSRESVKKAGFSKFASEIGDLQEIMDLEYTNLSGQLAAERESFREREIYYMIATGEKLEDVADIEVAGRVAGLTGMKPSLLKGTNYYEITDKERISKLKEKDEEQRYFITDKGEVFALPGYDMTEDTSNKWYVNTEKYYESFEAIIPDNESIVALGDKNYFNQLLDTESLVFSIEGRRNPIKEIKVDGEILDSENYTLKNNNKIIELNTNYLMNLALGEYTFEIVTELNVLRIPFTVKYAPKDTQTMIYDINNLDKNITYSNFTITPENRHKIGYTGEENEKLVIPVAFYDEEDGKWYKVTKLGNYAFDECENLYLVSLPDGVTNFGIGLFWDCSNLTSVNIPKGTTSIGNNMFRNCSSLVSIKIPEGVTSICGFEGCSSLTLIKLPNTLKTIRTYTFRGCKSLTSIEIPESVDEIGGYVFQSCRNLTSVNIPDGITTINNHTFYGCPISSINIPKSVVLIKLYAFLECYDLKDIYYEGTIEEWNNIEKEEDWDRSTNAYTIHCSDGDIAK